jgi:hypothetical protein
MRRRGKPPYQPTEQTRRQVTTMTGLGIIQDDIARWLEIDDKTLRKHFRRELDTGAIEANMRVASSLYTMATQDKNVAAAIWWTKTRMGWKEAHDLNIAGTYVIETGVPRADGAITTGVPRANGFITLDQETD